jgi:Ca2+-binding EF-hand superfamily protein
MEVNELKELRQIFIQLDVDKTGTLEYQEIESALKMVGSIAS